MDYTKILEILLAVVVGFGGPAGIIILVIKFTGKNTVEFFHNKLQHKYEIEIESFKEKREKEMQESQNAYALQLEEIKKEYAKELENIKGNVSHSNYVSKVKFDQETKAYEELFDSFYDMRVTGNMIVDILKYSGPQEAEKMCIELKGLLAGYIRNFDCNYAYIPEKISKLFNHVAISGKELAFSIDFNPSIQEEEMGELANSFEEMMLTTQNEVRTRFEELEVIY